MRGQPSHCLRCGADLRERRRWVVGVQTGRYHTPTKELTFCDDCFEEPMKVLRASVRFQLDGTPA